MLLKNTFQELESLVLIIMKAGLVPFVQGKPGVGKSSLWRTIADKYNLCFLDIRLTTYEPILLNGFIWLNEDQSKATFKSLDRFPLEDTPLPVNPITKKPYAGWLLHLDEFTQTPKSMEGAAFQLILDRIVGDKKLHPKVKIVASGNPVGQGMIAKSISTPMRTRLIHFELENSVKSFTPKMIELGYHNTVIAYLVSSPDMLNNFDKQAGNVDGTYACERSWEMLSNLVKVMEKTGKITKEQLPILNGAVGEVAGNGYYAFLQQYYNSPDIKDIIQSPHHCMIPTNSVAQYATIAYLVANVTANNGSQLALYLARYKEEFQFIFGKMLLNQNEKLFDMHFKHLTALVAKYAI